MTKILQGMPGTAHELMGTLSAVLLKYEPRLKRIDVVLLEQNVPGELRYAIDAELRYRPGALRHRVYAGRAGSPAAS
jgi:type VI secretion system protein